MIIHFAQVEDAPAVARVHVDTWHTTYTGIVPQEFLDNLSYQRSQANWETQLKDPLDGMHLFLAEDQPGQVIGFACGGPLRQALADYDGELYAIYILESFQRKGCGRLLVNTVACDLARRGFHSLVIWVLKDNPACRFYVALGGKFLAEKMITIGGKQLPEVAYGWSCLDPFTHHLPDRSSQ